MVTKSQSPAPVGFVMLGTQRTGTTWIRTTLDSHPSVSALGELFLYGRSRFRPLPKSGAEIAGSYRNYLAESTSRRFADLFGRPSQVRRFLDNLYARPDIDAVGFKFMRSHARQFPSVIPYLLKKEIRAIHIVRENVLKTYISRETARRRKLFHASTQVQATKINIDSDTLLAALEEIKKDNSDWARIFANSRYLRVAYEDFVANRQSELQRICDFLSVDSEQQVTSPLVKINPDRIQDIVQNFEEIRKVLDGTRFAHCLDDE